jgi:hypothetical protein
MYMIFSTPRTREKGGVGGGVRDFKDFTSSEPIQER